VIKKSAFLSENHVVFGLLQEKIDVVYNVQLGFDSSCRDNVSMSALLRGDPLLCDIYMERLELESLPKDDAQINDWLMNLFKRKASDLPPIFF
jgi:hypothetical protein